MINYPVCISILKHVRELLITREATSINLAVKAVVGEIIMTEGYNYAPSLGDAADSAAFILDWMEQSMAPHLSVVDWLVSHGFKRDKVLSNIQTYLIKWADGMINSLEIDISQGDNGGTHNGQHITH